MEAESSVRFGQQDVAAAAGGTAHHSGSGAGQVIPAAAMVPAGMGSLLAGVGISATTGLVLPAGALTSAGYGAVPNSVLRTALHEAAMEAGGLPRAGGVGNGERAPPQKGPWTAEEDDILKDMVRKHGDRKWAMIARYLPGRIGKQCRERWTNHLRPDIKKSMWTKEDDLALIEAHKTCGNRWSVIARFLPGRSENAVKNHWNATKRSLKAKRRLKKKKNLQAPPGQQWSVLEEYIRSLYPAAAAADPVALPPPVSPPSYSNRGYGEVVSPPATAAAATPVGFDPTGMGMYLNAANSSSNLGPMNLNVPLLLDLNAYYGMPLQAMAEVKPQMMDQDQQKVASYANLMMSYPFVVDNLVWQSSVHAANAGSSSAGAVQCYGEAAAGADHPGGGGADDVDVVQMASREFLMPSEDEATLDLARFM